MLFKATPLAINMARSLDPRALFARVVMPVDDYVERATVEVEATGHHDACEEIWGVFQNIDHDHVTPDGGRSLMVGDLLRLVDERGEVSHWIARSMGWREVLRPNVDVVDVPREDGLVLRYIAA